MDNPLSERKRAQQYFGQIIGPNLAQARENAGLTQREVSVALDMQERNLRRWESGQIVPEYRNLMALADVLSVKPESLFVPVRSRAGKVAA